MAAQITKLCKQSEQTWNHLHKRLIGIPEPSESLFREDVWLFLKNKAVSVSSNVGFFVASIIATCAYIAGLHSKIFSCGREMPMNIYTIFIGPPGTGKSQVLKECTQNAIDVICEERGTESLGLHRCTPSGTLHSFVVSLKSTYLHVS